MSDFLNIYPYTDFHELNLDWVIERVKKLTEDWAATLEEWNSTEEQWQQLYDYVHDYFDNLDVQQEINNKINQMILDGTFVTITTPVIEAKVASMMPGTVASQIGDTVASQIGSTVASQIGPTVASQIDAAVVSPVNTWLAAHITQPTTPVVDTSLTIAGAAADSEVVGKWVNTLRMTCNDAYMHVGYLQNNGTFYEQANTNCLVSLPYKVKENDVLLYKGRGGYSAVNALFYDASMTLVSDHTENTNINKYYSITIPAGVSYAVFTSYAVLPNYPVLEVYRGDAYIQSYGYNRNEYLINPVNLVVKDFTNGYIDQTTHKVIANASFRTTKFIQITETGYYIKHVNAAGLGTSAPMLCIYADTDENTFVSELTGTDMTGGSYLYNIGAEYIGMYMRFSSGGSGSETDIYIGRGSTVPSPIPGYDNPLNSNVTIDYSQITNTPTPSDYSYDGPLTSKKWYLIGDSATHGDFTSITPPVFPAGTKYAGELCVYPFYIGNRTGMEVYNLAVNGAVMATIPGDTTHYQWSADDHYKLVGADADYITIWIGANDMWQHVSIGSISSNDSETFYGAYNNVLTWLINNRPDAKIGLVASYWCTQPYAEAVINLGAKYGIPVLNFYNDPDVPVSVGSQRPDVDAAIISLRDTQYRVSATNAHGSAKFHELESYFIESWLLTL